MPRPAYLFITCLLLTIAEYLTLFPHGVYSEQVLCRHIRWSQFWLCHGWGKTAKANA